MDIKQKDDVAHVEQKKDTENQIGSEGSKPLKKKLFLQGLFCVCACCIFLLGTSCFVPTFWLPDREAYVQVREQMTAADIAAELHDEELIVSPTWFRFIVTATGQGQALKQGEYTIRSHMSLYEIISKLESGKSEAARLVIPEGYTARQIAKEVDRLGIISEADFLAAANRSDHLYAYMEGNRQVSVKTEGFLFPDTYFIHNSDTADDLVKMMLDNFDKHLTQEMKKGIADKGMSIYQFVTLASLVEKEAKFDDDRLLIASVFQNRLQAQMKLQSDASVSYATGTHKSAYDLDEIEYDSPYNTYLHAGLPPGPIGNPGEKSMESILKAPETSYMYFVADAQGHNYFAMTYEDHMKNVHQYMP